MKIIMLPTMSSMTVLLERIKNNLSGKQTSLFYLFILLFLVSCSKEPGQIGYILQPEDSKLQVYYTDTTSLYAYSVIRDSVRTSQLSSTGLGATQDPIFGSTVAGFYTQFMLSSPGQDFAEGSVLDSLILQLEYSGIYGDTNQLLRVHTYEMLRNLDNDSIYYSNIEVPVGTTDFSDLTFLPRPNDSIIVDGDTLPAMLRINLSNISTEMGYKLLTATSDQMESSAAFQEYFNGVFVQSEPVNGDGCIAFFDLSALNSKMTLYYTVDDTNSLSYESIITTSSAFVGKYEHNRIAASQEFRSQVVNGDTLLGQEKFYIQGFGGVEAIIRFPYIFDWAKRGNVGINEAKLILPGTSDTEFFGPPSQLTLLKINSDTSYSPLEDQSEGEVYFDGFYNKGMNAYEFRITRYIQSMIKDTTMPNHGLLLYVYGGSFYPNRIILKGNENGSDTTGIRLNIIYTDL